MAKYEPHPTQEGKFQCTECNYGHDTGKSRQAVNSHYNRMHKTEEKSTSPPTMEGDNSESLEVEEKPDWLKFDMSGEEENVEVISINPLAKSFIHGLSNKTIPTSDKELKMYYEHQGKMLAWIFTGVLDPIVSWYGRAITANQNFTVRRSNDDVELLESASAQWLEYRDLSIPLTPDIVMATTIGSMYAPALYKIHKKRHPSKPSLWRKFKARRALKKALKAERDANA